jgi:acylphosphatase
MLVSGRVQGVYFRAHTARHAAELGVVGHARNLDDGRVEVLAAGTPEALDALTAIVRRGPPLAVVEAVIVSVADAAEVAGLTGFARE